jgi:3',5'-cyclic AMP phosphodiesterase CpdA
MEDVMVFTGYCRVLSPAVIAVLIGMAGGCTATEKDRAPFSVVLLPDTQNYSEKYPGTYLSQTCWIKDRAQQDNIRFVIHLGDIVQHDDVEQEWINADLAHRAMDGFVPYSMLPGNHDMKKRDKRRIRSYKSYNKYFPPSRFEKYTWYGGHKDDTNVNNYCFFEAGGMKFIVLSLEFAPRDETLEWASGVLRSHGDRRAILATHYHLRTDGRGKETPYDLAGSIGQDLWSKFIRKHANIFMVVCGHIGGTYHQTDINDAGAQVHEILCDYQAGPNGGDGWLQVLRFVPSENRIDVVAYSPLLDKYNKGPKHTYTLDYNMGATVCRKAG